MSAMAEKSSESAATSCSVAGAGAAGATADIRTWPAVLQRLKRNDPTLTSLGVQLDDSWNDRKGYFHPRDMENWQRLGEAIAANTALRRLDLRHSSQNYAVYSSWHLLFFAQLTQNATIRRLSLHRIALPPHLLQFLERNPSLTSLTVTGCYAPGLQRCGTLVSSSLATSTSSLKYLDLSGTGIGDAACERLIEALRSGHPKLRSLELNGILIGNLGCDAISSLLSNPNSLLVRIFLDKNSITDEGAAALANGLVGNTRLKTLSIRGNLISLRGYEAFSEALCNAPDIDDILLSNHTLERLDTERQNLSWELKSLLRLNRARNKRCVANRKFVMHHLVYNCNWVLLGTVPGGLLPSVLAMVADHAAPQKAGKNDRTDAEAGNYYSFIEHDYNIRHLALHRIVRRCPSVCERNVVRTRDGKVSTSSGRSGDTGVCASSKRMRLS